MTSMAKLVFPPRRHQAQVLALPRSRATKRVAVEEFLPRTLHRLIPRYDCLPWAACVPAAGAIDHRSSNGWQRQVGTDDCD